MTSLIFGSIYMGHSAIVHHRREKQRVKNYERWEGLRDEYDEQRKITRESRSLDLQRTGNGLYEEEKRPILTLRDQQEANDARTSWRPQESWEPSFTGNQPQPRSQPQRTSIDMTRGPSFGSSSTPLKYQRTGSVWDEGLPAPLRVARMNWDDDGVRTTSSTPGRIGTPPAPSPAFQTQMPSRLSESRTVSGVSNASAPDFDRVEIIENETPGGKMAQLIDGLKTPGVEKDMEEWWK